MINVVKIGNKSRISGKKCKPTVYCDSSVVGDLEHSSVFPPEISLTIQSPDIVISSVKSQKVNIEVAGRMNES